ncbi:MAG: hypothetical protein WBV82_30405 [Myxococcaceae bacterium]
MPSSARRIWGRLVAHRETISTVVMSMSAVITTWCAFESTAWSGLQSIRFAEAGANRLESTRAEVKDNQNVQVDIATFLAWLEALQRERGPHAIESAQPYEPDPRTLSGFIYQRFRPDFRPAVQAWVATRPLVNPDAPPTPFAMKEYRRPLTEHALALAERTEAQVREGREARRTSDQYLMITVISAMTLFFAGLSTKLSVPLNGAALLLFAMLGLLLSLLILSQLPVRTVFEG